MKIASGLVTHILSPHTEHPVGGTAGHVAAAGVGAGVGGTTAGVGAGVGGTTAGVGAGVWGVPLAGLESSQPHVTSMSAGSAGH
jgi:hypothetical protein